VNLEEFSECVRKVDVVQLQKLVDLIRNHEKIIILGNGGSSAIASHISQDYTKKLKKRSFTFSDSSRLTCYINDYGMDRAYSRFLEEFADPDSLVILISSSGNSQNIISCAEFCDSRNITYAILTGFNQNNKLRTSHSSFAKADIWVDSVDYGVVECAHQVLLHVPA
jgi:D-sedoheptulose 7-phosphate isomerase